MVANHDPAGRRPRASLNLGTAAAERRGARSGAAPAALAFALGAVALWATNALVGKTLLALYPVSQVQFLQFCGAVLVFALIRLFPSPLVGSEGRGETRGSPQGGDLAKRGRMRGDGRIADIGPSSNTPYPSRHFAPIHLLRQGEKGRVSLAYAVGFLGLVGTMVLQYIAFASMPVIEANLVAYTWPLMTAAAVILLGRPRRPLLLGLAAALGFAGVALVISGGRAQTLSEGGSVVGYLAAFGSALCMAFYSLTVGRLGVPPERLLLPSALVGVALTFAWCLHVGIVRLTGAHLLLGLYLGAGPMGLGYYFWSRAAKLDHGGRIAVVAYLTPIASTFLLTLSGDSLSMTAVAGAVIVIGSCLAVGIEGTETGDDVQNGR